MPRPSTIWLVQASGDVASLDAALDAIGGERLGGHAQDAQLVRLPESVDGAALTGVPGVSAAVQYRPAYKAAPVLEGVIDQTGLTDLADEDGYMRFMTVWHFDEDPRAYESAIAALLPPLAMIDATVVPTGAGSARDSHAMAVAVAPDVDQVAQADAALRVLMGVEALAIVRPWADAARPFERFITTYQVGAMPEPPSTWTFDEPAGPVHGPMGDPDGYFAKLFARGLTGRGQLLGVTDRGFDSVFDVERNCRFTYGPNAGDQPPALTPSIAPGYPAAGLGWLRPTRKILAALAPAPLAPCTQTNPEHGWNSAFWAASEQPFVLAARAGIQMDDPYDDEESSLRSENFGHLVDAHQQSDAPAPGAQLFLQDFVAERDGGLSCDVQLWPWGDMVQQAYDIGQGVRIHDFSWGEFNGATPESPVARTAPEDQQYAENARTFDLASWRRRDWLPFFSIGNKGAGGTNTLLLESQVKNGLAIGGESGVTENMGTSSRGPGYAGTAGVIVPGEPFAGGRIKPDLVTTMTLNSASDPSENCLGHPWVVTGTSTSAPLAASLAVGVRQYFVDGYYPGGSPESSPGFSPSNALLKAVLINATRSLTGAATGDAFGENGVHRPTRGQGWGRPVLDDTLFFAGDPITLASGSTRRPERSFLAVLNDAPNGLDPAVLPNDDRHLIVDEYRGSLVWPAFGGPPTVREHVYQIRVDRSEDLHVTLAWSDPPPPVSYLGLGSEGGNPLRNDLDLELLSPSGETWRPQPGLRTGDAHRLWNGGFSTVGSTNCPGGCSTTCPAVIAPSRERDFPQILGAECDFGGRDGVNTVENVFLEALPGGGLEDWQLRVLWPYRERAGLTNQEAWPNLNDTDGDLTKDFISDSVQGYALVASGNLATSAGVPYFGASRYECGEELVVFLRDADTLSNPEVTVTTDTDCTVIVLEQATFPDPDFLWRSPAGSLFVLDETAGAVESCPGTDEFIVASDDSYIKVSYTDDSPAGRIRTATTRFTCRNVQYVSSAFYPADGTSPCQADTSAPIDLQPGGSGYLNVTFMSDGGVNATGLTATIWPENHFVSTPAGAVTMPDASPDTTASFPIQVHPDVCLESPATLRFRVEVEGALSGFRDRSYFDVPLNCAMTGTDTLAPARPDEVPESFLPPPSPLAPSLRVSKTGVNDADITISFEGVAGSVNHVAWRGTIAALMGGGYDHAIEDDSLANDLCSILGGAGSRGVELTQEDDLYPGGRYYLATAVADCGGSFEIKGSAGTSRVRSPGGTWEPFENRPDGVVWAPQCQ